MNLFIGTKIIKATPMNRQEYNDYRGWELPEDEKHLASEDGFLVEYADHEHKNHPDHEGYISWSPGNVFEKSYRLFEKGNMNIGQAIQAMKDGMCVARKGWNGKNMFLYIVEGSTVPLSKLRGRCQDAVLDKGNPLTSASQEICPHIDMYAADGSIVVGWLASQSDLLSEDWEIV